jgi:hypothetical protein
MRRSLFSPEGEPLRCLPALVVLVSLCLGLFSCAHKEVLKRPPLAPYEGPVTVGILRQSVGFGDIRSIKALDEVNISKKGKAEGSLNGVFAYKAPGRMRIDLFGPFGLTAAEILVSDELIQISVPSKNLLYEWNSPEIRFSGLSDSRFSYEMEEEADGYVLLASAPEATAAHGTVKYFFDRTYLLNRAIRFYRDGSEALRAEFSSFNGRVPEEMRLVFADGLVLDIALREAEYDTDIADEYFRRIEHGDKRIKSFREIFLYFPPLR